MSETGPRRSVFRGIFKLARFQPEGFGEFVATRQAFLNSLAPLIAFPLVGGLLMLVSGDGGDVLTDLLATLVALLAPAVISAGLAERWGRGEAWLRFGVAFNWAQWAVPVVAIGFLFAAGMLRRMGLGEPQAAIVVLFAIAGYGLSLHWFLVRYGLGLSRGRATLMVLALNMGTVGLVMAPRVIASVLQ